MNTITTTIKREFLAAIIAGTKKVEYREFKPYWTKRLTTLPFKLRLINGMSKSAPEVTVLIGGMGVGNDYPDEDGMVYALYISEVLGFKNWDKQRGIPSQRRTNSRG